MWNAEGKFFLQAALVGLFLKDLSGATKAAEAYISLA